MTKNNQPKQIGNNKLIKPRYKLFEGKKRFHHNKLKQQDFIEGLGVVF
jgi:hypothetical protein